MDRGKKKLTNQLADTNQHIPTKTYHTTRRVLTPHFFLPPPPPPRSISLLAALDGLRIQNSDQYSPTTKSACSANPNPVLHLKHPSFLIPTFCNSALTRHLLPWVPARLFSCSHLSHITRFSCLLYFRSFAVRLLTKACQ